MCWMRAHLRLVHTTWGSRSLGPRPWALCVCDHSLFLPAQGADGIRGLKGTKGEKVRVCPREGGLAQRDARPSGVSSECGGELMSP